MNQHWRQLANCRGADRDIFYPEKAQSSRSAKAICNGDDEHPECPVKQQCLEFALSFEGTERYGVFGGLSAYDRTRIYDGKKGRGLRRKCAEGHEYTPQNTVMRGNQRRCLTCLNHVPSVEEHGRGHVYVLWRDAAGTKRCKTCYDERGQNRKKSA